MQTSRAFIPFRSVNRRDSAGYQAGLQRHHLIPRQVQSRRCFGNLIAALQADQFSLDDFRRNGMLLPAEDAAAAALQLPLHRGPHRTYNELVLERFGQIEASWCAAQPSSAAKALAEAHARLTLLQAALRKRLLSQRAPLQLNRHQTPRPSADFAALDAMAASLWAATG